MFQIRSKTKKRIYEYLLITLGCILYSVSFCWWFEPNRLAFGGLTGISQVIGYFFHNMPIGITTILINIPLFLIGVRLIGRELLTSSVYAMALSSILIDVLDSLISFPASEPLLAAIYGGVILGFALGLMLLSNATTGGTELLARILKFRFRNLSIGRLCLIIDLVIIVFYALIYNDLNNALYGIIALYISTLIMDMVIYGSSSAKLAYIISDHSSLITQKLLDLELGITLLDGQGAYMRDDKKIILCALRKNQITMIKNLVRETDPHAFIIVCTAHEVLGEGFTPNVPGML